VQLDTELYRHAAARYATLLQGAGLALPPPPPPAAEADHTDSRGDLEAAHTVSAACSPRPPPSPPPQLPQQQQQQQQQSSLRSPSPPRQRLLTPSPPPPLLEPSPPPPSPPPPLPARLPSGPSMVYGAARDTTSAVAARAPDMHGSMARAAARAPSDDHANDIGLTQATISEMALPALVPAAAAGILLGLVLVAGRRGRMRYARLCSRPHQAHEAEAMRELQLVKARDATRTAKSKRGTPGRGTVSVSRGAELQMGME